MSLLPAACDFLGERLASLLGLDAAKYQYAIDQHANDLHRRHHPQDGPQVGERTGNRTEQVGASSGGAENSRPAGRSQLRGSREQ